MTERFCLRCKDVVLARLSPAQDVAFFECPQCRRQFALKPGQDLTFKFGHPMSVMLYPVIFSASPLADVNRVAQDIIESTPAIDWNAAAAEAQLELDDPTQRLRDILGCPASEAELREYLSALCSYIRGRASGERRG